MTISNNTHIIRAGVADLNIITNHYYVIDVKDSRCVTKNNERFARSFYSDVYEAE